MTVWQFYIFLHKYLDWLNNCYLLSSVPVFLFTYLDIFQVIVYDLMFLCHVLYKTEKNACTYYSRSSYTYTGSASDTDIVHILLLRKFHLRFSVTADFRAPYKLLYYYLFTKLQCCILLLHFDVHSDAEVEI